MAKKRTIKLSQSESERLNAAIRELHDVLPSIQAFQECGEDCSELLEIQAGLERDLTHLKERFS